MAKKKKTFRKYIKRGWHILVRSVEAVIAFCFVLSIMLFLRLLKGPIEMDFFTPVLEKVLVQKDNQKVSVGMVYLELDTEHGHLCAVRATNISVKNENDESVVEIPKASFAFNLLPLLTGNFIPSSLVIESPYLWTVTMEQMSEPVFEEKVVSEGVLHTVGHLFSSLKDLDYFEIKNGRWLIDIEAVQKKVNIPNLSFSIERRGRFLLGFSGEVILYEGEDAMPLKLQGEYHTNTNLFFADTYFEEMPIKKFGSILCEIKGIDVILNGTLSAVLDMNAKTLPQIVKKLTVAAESTQKGTVYLPDPIDTTYFIDSLIFAGSFSEGLKSFEITESIATVGEATVFAQMKIDGIDTLLDTGKTEGLFATLKTQAKNISLSELPVLWPSKLGTPAYDWVTTNMKTGIATDASFTFLLQDKKMVDLKGTVKVENATVDYLEGLPPVKGAEAIVSFFPDKILIEAIKGHTGNLVLEKATVDFFNLGDDVVPLQIVFTAKGPIKEGMDILSKKPLELVNFLNLDYKKMDGEGKATVKLYIPISDAFKPSDIKVDVDAKLRDISLVIPYTDLRVDKGEGRLYADNDEIKVRGHVSFDGNPFEVEWAHQFDSSVKQPGKGMLIGQVSDALLKPYYSNVSDIIKGNIPVRAEVVFESEALQKIDVTADLKNAKVFIPIISYDKEAGSDSVFSLTAETGGGELLSVPFFRFEEASKNTLIDGSIALNKGFLLDLKHLETPQNDAKVSFEKSSDSVKVSVSGKKLNFAKYLHAENKETEKDQTEKKVKRFKNFEVNVQLDELFLSDENALKKADISLKKENGLYTKWEGSITALSPLFLKKSDNGDLEIQTDDFGSFLNYAGYSDRIRGGILNVKMKQEEGNLVGAFEMRDYALTETPFFMQAVTILGILDAFKGDEIAFKKASVPFVIKENNDILIEDGVAYGTAVGVTFQGSIKSNDIALSGSVIPAYAVNSLPGKIPFIGRIFSGDKGGGLIGLAFEIKGNADNPELIFKPSSLLTPGFIRNIFN